MLVPFVPSSVDNFSQRWICVETFQFFYLGRNSEVCRALASRWGCYSIGIVEQQASCFGCAGNFIGDEVVEFIVLDIVSQTLPHGSGVSS